MSAAEGGVSKPAQNGPHPHPDRHEPEDGLGFDTALRAYSPRGLCVARAYSSRGPGACGLLTHGPGA